VTPAPLITLEGVTLWRRTQEEYAYDLKRSLFAMVQRRYRKPSRRCVLRNVSLAVRPGEKLGIIGPNGSGKSTLLKVIAGILKPTSGSVHVGGSVAPLIELGAGFDPDLSVIDNIVYYGVLLGHDRAWIRGRLDAILDFAQLYDHANEPLKALSSGMAARLGFAIATESSPDILILDEVLSVGDESFRRRSAERLARFWDERVTVIVVSHETAFIRAQCERAVLIEEGEVVSIDAANAVVDRYQRRVADGSARGGHAAAHIDSAAITKMNGKLFRGNGTVLEEQKLFLIREGRKHWIRDPEWVIQNGFNWSRDVTYLEGGVLTDVAEGDPI
jgi:ABC-type polysaccharide/polyol phosphate transport system ATPase subunit